MPVSESVDGTLRGLLERYSWQGSTRLRSSCEAFRRQLRSALLVQPRETRRQCHSDGNNTGVNGPGQQIASAQEISATGIC